MASFNCLHNMRVKLCILKDLKYAMKLSASQPLL